MGGGTESFSLTPSEMYTQEIKYSWDTSKIGLMYASDYGFASSPSSWNTTLNNYNNINWMYMGYIEWLNSVDILEDETALVLNDDGHVSGYFVFEGCGTRPVMYLKASVLYAGGSGTKNSPITLVV